MGGFVFSIVSDGVIYTWCIFRKVSIVIHRKKRHDGTKSGPSWYEKRVIMYLFLFRFLMLFHLCVMNEELTNEQRKEWAKHLYTRETKGFRHIAELVGVDEAQLRQWVAEGSWDAIKKTLPTSKEYQLEQLYELLGKITEKINNSDDPNPKDVDLVVKYTAAIKNLDTETSIQQIVDVAKLFTTWLQHKDINMAKKVALEFDGFIRQRIRPNAA